MPFDLASSSQPESNSFSEHALLVSSQACGPANPELAHSSKQRVTAWDPAPRAADIASDAYQLSRHPFKMLPTAVFEQLSDPNLLSSDGNLGFNLLLGSAQPVQQQQQEHKLDFGERQSDENRVQSLMVSVQQKPVWMGSNTGTTLLLLHATVRVTLQDMDMLSVAVGIRSLSIRPAKLRPMLPAYKGRSHLDHSAVAVAVAEHEAAVIHTK